MNRSNEESINIKTQSELLEMLAEAENDVRENRVAPISDTFNDLRKSLQEK